MKSKTIIKVIVDIIMTALFFALMAYHITGNRLHEWLGAALFTLFIIHHILNWNWYRALPKGKYKPVRILETAINFLLFAAMLGMIVSGVMLSREVFGFLSISAGWFGRRLHMVSAAWGYVLMSAHLGLHWGMVVGAAKKLATKNGKNVWTLICRVAAATLSVYGIYASISRQIWLKMFLLIEYAFFDYEEPAIFFFADYIAIMGLFAGVVYYAVRLIRHRRIERYEEY